MGHWGVGGGGRMRVEERNDGGRMRDGEGKDG